MTKKRKKKILDSREGKFNPHEIMKEARERGLDDTNLIIKSGGMMETECYETLRRIQIDDALHMTRKSHLWAIVAANAAVISAVCAICTFLFSLKH
jgi:hypothetical protein